MTTHGGGLPHASGAHDTEKAVGTVRKKTALVVAWAMAVGGYLVVSQGTAPGAVPFPGAQFNGFSTGTNVHADVLRTSAIGPVLADVEVAFSGAAVDSVGFPAGGVQNEENIAVVPAPGSPDAGVDSAGKESFGKGTGLEVGLATGLPNNDLNQIVLGGRAEGGAQPAQRSDGAPPLNVNDTGDVDTSLATITEADPLLYLRALFGQARARWNESFCITDGDLSRGRGQVAQAQLVDTSSDAATPDLDAPLVDVHADFFGDDRGVADTRSRTYLVPNPDGSFGLAAETRMTFAPIGLLQTSPAAPPPVFVEILGEWIFRAVATGKPGGAAVTYEVAGLSADPDPTVIRIYLGAADANALPTIEIKRSELFSPTGLVVDIPPGLGGPKLLSLTVGEDIRAISAPNVLPDPASQPTEAANGTSASGAADVIRISALNANSLDPNGPQVAGVRVGHLEAKVEVPADGISCPTPPPPPPTTTSTSTSTTVPGATTTTTTPGGGGSTTTTTPAGGTTTTTTPAVDPNAATTTTSSIPTAVRGENFSRAATPPAQPVTAQPRFTG